MGHDRCLHSTHQLGISRHTRRIDRNHDLLGLGNAAGGCDSGLQDEVVHAEDVDHVHVEVDGVHHVQLHELRGPDDQTVDGLDARIELMGCGLEVHVGCEEHECHVGNRVPYVREGHGAEGVSRDVHTYPLCNHLLEVGSWFFGHRL